MPANISGIFTPNIVPLDDRGQIDEPELRRYIEWLITKGVHGLYPNGSTGEFLRFTPDERRRIVAVIVDQAAGRVPVLAGAAEANTRETLAACEYYARLGVRAVAIVAPFYYRLSPENVYAYFREIGRNTPVDVTLYNIPMFASPIDVPTLVRLADECPRIVAIKDSSGDLAHMERMIAAVRPRRPDFAFLTGWEAVLAPMLMIGCDGGTNATSGVVPELTRAIYQAATTGRRDEALRLQAQLLPLFDVMLTGVDFPEGFRVGMRLRGFRPGRGRQPLAAEHAARLERLEAQLVKLLAELGLLDGPTSAPTCEASLVEAVVQSVLATMKRM